MLPVPPGLGAELRAARLAQDLTLRELGKKCGISYGRLSQIEHGANINLNTFVRAAQALGFEVELTLRHAT